MKKAHPKPLIKILKINDNPTIIIWIINKSNIFNVTLKAKAFY